MRVSIFSAFAQGKDAKIETATPWQLRLKANIIRLLNLTDIEIPYAPYTLCPHTAEFQMRNDATSLM